MKKPDKLSLLLVVYALAYGAIMLSLGGFHAYETSPYHRYQAEALLHGHLYLADSIYALQPGLAWHDGHVQHVWGLGIGLWLLPFEAFWRLFGNQPFPDRIALGLAFALLAFFSGATSLKLVRQGQFKTGLGLIWLVALCPALWTLARNSQLVFEETVLYSVILSLGILVSLVRVAAFDSKRDYFLCCALGAFAVWVRPTDAVYGLAAVLLASWIVWLRQRCLKQTIAGVFLWFASLALLAWTNYARFGSPTEFGHHLTVSSGTMMYLTRFGNPCREATFAQAAKELFGLLFLVEPRGANAFSDNLFPGQSPFARWHRLDMTTFDLSYAFLGVIAVVAAIFWLMWRRRKKETVFWQQPKIILVFSLLLWSGVSTVGLGGFYLHYPAIASRYLLDFAPAVTGLVMLIWILLPAKAAKLLCPLLAGWLVYQIALAKVPVEDQHQQQPIQLSLPQAQGTPLNEFNGIYTPENHPSKTRIAGNGYGWEPDTGFAADVVSLAVDKPQFVELHVSKRRALYGGTGGDDIYQAQIDGVSLPLRDIARNGDGLKVTFDIPEAIRLRKGDEILFLCFSGIFGVEDRDSERFLFSVRWR